MVWAADVPGNGAGKWDGEAVRVGRTHCARRIAREVIDGWLRQSGWIVQSNNKIDFSAGPGIAVREYQADVGPAENVLFVDKAPVGVVEAKREDRGQELMTDAAQSGGYATI